MTSRRALRRHTLVAAASVGVLVASSGLVASGANADTVGSLRAQADAIASRITQLGYQEDALSEKYDQAVSGLAAAKVHVAAARTEVSQALGKEGAARQVLETEALDAYMSSGTGAADESVQGVAGATSGLLREEYQQSLASSQADNEDRYKLDSEEASTAESNLKTQEAAAAAQVRAIDVARSQVSQADTQLVQEESLVQGRLSAAVAAAAAAQAAAEARLEAQRLAAEQAAAAATTTTTVSAVGGGTEGTVGGGEPTTTPTTSPSAGATTTTTIASGSGSGGGSPVSTPAPSSAAAAAVAAAESRVGDPYVWGAAGPDAFDCSGLVMWAYAQAGISLPHYSGAQYADMTHIPMTDLEPGDVVFFADPGEHEAMYIGNGEIVEAPYTGADVHIVPMYSEFVLAGRPT